ncbi:MAG: hypothetical protein IJA80_09325 [Clostridia bacterium]|nr:hypothetical protein [Clostridia bacterium]
MSNPSGDANKKNEYCKTACTLLAVLLTIMACIMPMDNLSLWNGEQPGHRNQYELMAEAILDGRLDIDYGEDTLANLENPYNPQERDDAGVWYPWDHAYYNGHYYMYFGIVPVFLVFLPYRVLTGQALTTFRGTQIFVVFIIIGIFVLFDLLRKRFFKNMSYMAYIGLSVAVSVMSVWYSSAEPALYCTAITAAIALQVWSLYFFIRAVWYEKNENKQIAYAAVGALLGALVFGCRPPIALANIIVLPMLYVFIKQRKLTIALLGKLALAALPYVFVGVGLMAYNYVRFDNPFEFGQAYQLTVADQSQYGFAIHSSDIIRIFNGVMESFFQYKKVNEAFPFLETGGMLFNYPLLLLSLGAIRSSSISFAKKDRLIPLVFGIFAVVLIITAVDVLWTPYLLERYHMDTYFLMGILCFMGVGLWYSTITREKTKRIFCLIVVGLSIISVVSSFLYYVDTVCVYYPEKAQEIGNALFFRSIM